GLGIETLKSVVPGMTAMNPGGTAFAFLLAGVALWVHSVSASHRVRKVGKACAGLVVGLALLRLGGYLVGWDGGPDQFLFRQQLDLEAAGTGLPNRMAPNTAAGLLLAGLALLLLDAPSRRGVWLAQSLSLAAGLIALLALLGYAYSALPLAGVERFIPMALNTAMALALISGRSLFARAARGLWAA